MSKKPVKTEDKGKAVDNELADLCERYAVADPGKDARDSLFRRMAVHLRKR